MGAGGLWTTATDLARLAVAVQAAWAGEEGAILSPALAQAMVTPVLADVGRGVFLDGTGAPTHLRHDADTPQLCRHVGGLPSARAGGCCADK